MSQRRGAAPVSDTEILDCPDTYARGVPYDCLGRLRARTPVVWLCGRPGGRPGSWAVLRYADVRHALDHPESFSPWPVDAPLHNVAAHEEGAGADGGGGTSPIDMEPPAHALLSQVTESEPVDFVTEVAGDLPETLRDTLAGGLYALLRHPGQHVLLRGRRDDDRLLDSAVEEMLRWWTPVMHVRRTVWCGMVGCRVGGARRGTIMGGVPLLADEQVTLWLTAANHDDTVFPEPGRFVPDRFLTGAPEQLSFGHGARSCLGARLARVHLRALLVAMLERPGRPELAGEPVRLRSSARHGFERLPVIWTTA